MAIFVVDASVALAWCFEDEATNWTDGLLERLRQGDTIVVPAHWPTEISNGLLMAVRRKRIDSRKPALFWDQVANLPIESEPPLDAARVRPIFLLSEKHALTVYDGAYLELAMRRGLAMGTLDSDLRKAAQAEGVVLL